MLNPFICSFRNDARGWCVFAERRQTPDRPRPLSHLIPFTLHTHTHTHTHTTAPTCKVCNGVWRVDVISQRRRYSTHARAAGRTLTISLCSSLTSEFEHSIVLSWSGMSSSADADAVSVCAEWGDPLRAMRGDPLRAMRVRTFADPTLSSCFCLTSFDSFIRVSRRRRTTHRIHSHYSASRWLHVPRKGRS